MKMFKVFTLMLCLGSMTSVSAKLIQIIHTNDMHSFFEGTRTGKGGYARLKTVVDSLKAEATAKGIPSLYLDAGDWGEGSSFYFSNQGVDSLRALDLFGVDAAVLGNHDFILGGTELSHQLKTANLKAKLLSANVVGKSKMGLVDLMPDFTDFTIDGLKVRVFGLTTPEIHYQYPMRPAGYISSSHRAGIKMAEKAQRDEIDFLISLNHIGLKKDTILVEHSRTIDLVVSGHDHVQLNKPMMVENLEGKLIPIVQAGAHSMAVGSVLMDIGPEGVSKLIDYKLIQVTKDFPRDAPMQEMVDQAFVNRENYFGRKWDDIVGSTEIPLSGIYEGVEGDTRTCWSRHIARLTRTTAMAELGLQFDTFQGEMIPPGKVTYGDLIDNFPHFRSWGDRGWNVTRARISGFILNQVIKILSVPDSLTAITVDGLDAMEDNGKRPVPYVFTRHQPYMARINGEPLHNMKFYSIGLPSEIPYAISRLSTLLGHLLLRHVEYLEDADYWPLFEDYISRNSPIKCLED